MKGNKVVIVDDILIHGRGINSIYRNIKKYCDGIEPDIAAYMTDIEIDCLLDEVCTRVKSFHVAYKGEWRNLSNKIVNCIFVSNVPYTSFVFSLFQYKNPVILEKLRSMDCFEVIENTDETQRKFGLHSYYFYEKTDEEEGLFASLALDKVIRIYWNDKIEKLTVIPYVFVKTMDISMVHKVALELRQMLSDEFVHIREILETKEENEEDNQYFQLYKMRLITCLLSNLYWKNINQRYQLLQDYHLDIDTADKSFGRDVAEELEAILYKDVNGIYDYNREIGIVSDAIDADLKSALEKSFEGTKEGNCDKMKSYFQKAWRIDEDNALKKVDRNKGLVAENFIEYGKKNDMDQKQILAWLVNAWDKGIASANYAMDCQDKYIGCFTVPGEQSYRIILEKYPYIMTSLIAISKLVKARDAGTNALDEIFEKYRENKLIQLLDKFDEKYHLKEYEELKRIIRQEKGYLNAWNQVGILREAISWDILRDEALVEDFIANNF